MQVPTEPTIRFVPFDPEPPHQDIDAVSHFISAPLDDGSQSIPEDYQTVVPGHMESKPAQIAINISQNQSSRALAPRLRLSQTVSFHPLTMNPLAPSSTVPIFQTIQACEDMSTKAENIAHDADDSKYRSRSRLKLLPASTTTSKISRLVNTGLFRKVSNALTMHPKNSGKRDQVTPHVLRELKPLGLRSLPHVPGQTLRTNEDANLHQKKKVQQMISARLKTLRHHKSFEDPFADPVFNIRKPTKFERRLRANSVCGFFSKDPFVTEGVLDGSINSLLVTEPIASSTPRASRVHESADSDSPIKSHQAVKTARQIQFSDTGRLNDNSHVHLSRRRSSLVSQKSADDAPIQPGGLPGLRYIPVVNGENRKKHPSPAKYDLELLEQEFRRHYLSSNADANESQHTSKEVVKSDERDELASCATSRLLGNVLRPKDQNCSRGYRRPLEPNRALAARKLYNRGVRITTLYSGAYGSSSPMLPPATTEARVVATRPPPHSEMIDELQMDAPAQWGMNKVF